MGWVYKTARIKVESGPMRYQGHRWRIRGGLAISPLLDVFAILIIGILLLGIEACSQKTVQPQSPKLSKTEQPNVPKSPSVEEQRTHNIQQATVAANRSFPGFLKGAWPQKTDYGFKAEDEQNDVSLAEPILVYDIDAEIVGKLNREEDLASAVKLIGELIYPVQVKHEYRTLFGVRLRGDEWHGAYLGNPYLAVSLHGIRKAWSSKDGDRFKLVSCIQPRSFFFIVLHADKPNLTPVTRVALGGGKYLAPPPDWNSITPAGSVLESLKNFWKSDANANGIGQLNDANK
jgi:hypothetical protein